MENAVFYGRSDLRGRPGTNAAQAIDECSSLVYIRVSVQSAPVLSRVARRICRNVRHTDSILLLEQVCVVGLPATPLQGAQSVARRLAALLVEVDCEIQSYAGLSALTLWQRMLAQHAAPVSVEEPVAEYPGASQAAKQGAIESWMSPQPIPYLAFLANYPPRRLLHLFPYELACRYRCVPVGAEHDMLTIGTSQRLDESVIEQMRKLTRRGIFQVRCDASMIDDVLRYWQGAQKLPSGVMEDV